MAREHETRGRGFKLTHYRHPVSLDPLPRRWPDDPPTGTIAGALTSAVCLPAVSPRPSTRRSQAPLGVACPEEDVARAEEEIVVRTGTEAALPSGTHDESRAGRGEGAADGDGTEEGNG